MTTPETPCSLQPYPLPSDGRLRVMTVFGTRPEAIKMAPVVLALQEASHQFESIVCVTAQHRQMLDQVLGLFGITPNADLDVMRPNQDLFSITTAVLNGMKDVLDEYQPHVVLVHGDTTTTMAASLACFYKKIPVGHVEAGLRTFNKYYPFPEEMNRVVTDSVASFYFAPTQQSAQNLRQAGVSEAAIVVTGNTVIDALLYTLAHGNPHIPLALEPHKKLVLVTTHRRENFGEPLVEICQAVLDIVAAHPDVQVVLPVHPNPNVKETVERMLGNHSAITLVEPMDYEPFCRLIEKATIVLTDSGGIQEEAPSLGKPVLVLRDETERPEAVTMGTVKLVGPHRNAIVSEVNRLLTDINAYEAMARLANPYGDGKACARILEALEAYRQSLLKATAVKVG